jgi:hypothetical protein
MVGAYLLYLGVNTFHTTRAFRGQFILTILLTMAAIVGIFVPIPIISDFAFWVMTAAYIIVVASNDIIRGPRP